MSRLSFSLLLGWVLAATLIAGAPPPTSGTVFLGEHDGKSVEFLGPDDLHLDPATNVVAVDVYGDRDREVNGVTFISDGREAGLGTATNAANGVSVTTTAANFIDNWAAAPGFTGGDRPSASNLAEIMRDIRYEDAPGPVTIDIEGLTPGVFYEVQILVNEGDDRNRFFDIAVEDELVADNLSSEGEAHDANGNGGQVWTRNNSFAYVGNFLAPSDGELNIVIQHELGGLETSSPDENVGYQAVIVHFLPPEKLENLEVTRSGTDLVFTWDSRGGKLYNLRSQTDPSAADLKDWPVFDGHMEIEATPPANTLSIPLPADPLRLFVVEEVRAPPAVVFSDDFESGPGDWTIGSDGAAGTEWELGAPSILGPAAANSLANCLGTNLAAEYGSRANVWLRTPPIDLTTADSAALSYFQFFDIEESFDRGTVSVLDAGDESVLAELVATLDGNSGDWQEVRKSLPVAVLGKAIMIEFRLISDDLQNFAGWYLDDINVTAP